LITALLNTLAQSAQKAAANTRIEKKSKEFEFEVISS
jgi:hypothetical protein